MKQAIFTISLDFELHWGGFEKWPLEKYRQYFDNTRLIIPKLLELFVNHGVHTTWATVGMLFHDSKEALLKNVPAHRPSYQHAELSAYNFIDSHGIGESEQDDPYHFAYRLVRQIVEAPFQELGSHTFSHFYCNEAGQTLIQFRDDLKSAQRAAGRFGKELTSLVFPRNQFNDEYLKACHDEGFRAVRSNPRDWFWNIQSTQNESFWKRLNRGLDAYFQVGSKNTFSLDSLERRPGLPVCIPASRLLRPYRPKELFLNSIKVARIKEEMSSAARNNEVYHLWWHPHNFGNYPIQNLEALKEILSHFTFCQQQYGMKSLSMCEIAALVSLQENWELLIDTGTNPNSR